MPPTPAPRRRRLLVALVVAASVVAVPLAAGAPAGATTAPLTTSDGVGIRVDETAIIEEVLDDLEAAMLPTVETILSDGAMAYQWIDDPDWILLAGFDLDLAIDFVDAGTTGFPDGGVRLAAAVENLKVRAYRYGEWWQPECSWEADLDPLTMVATDLVDASPLPAAPFTAVPTDEDWSSATPTETTVVGPWSCATYSLGFDWAGFSDTSDPASPAALFQDLLETTMADLVDRIWEDNVRAVLDSLTTLAGFDVAVDQVETDDHGLVVTAEVDATAGLTVNGSGPYPVGGAQDAGVTSNLNTLLATRSLGGVPSDVVVSLHPNLTNQYLAAVHDHLNGVYGMTPTSSAVAAALVDPTLGACYTATGWTMRLAAQAVPSITPSGTGGAPEMQLPQTTVQFRNAGCLPSDPRVATFTGSFDDIAVASSGIPLAPRGFASTATWTATRTQADAATAARVPAATASSLLSWGQAALGTFLGFHVPGHVELTPGAFPGRTAAHCDTCGRYTGDQRITETFHIS